MCVRVETFHAVVSKHGTTQTKIIYPDHVIVSPAVGTCLGVRCAA